MLSLTPTVRTQKKGVPKKRASTSCLLEPRDNISYLLVRAWADLSAACRCSDLWFQLQDIQYQLP
jgi:hypothetical protein